MFKTLLLTFLALNTLFANEKVSLQLQWKNQFEYAGFYMAKEKGFYNDVGLDVKFKEFDGHSNIIDDVLTQKSTYGTTYSDIISGYLNGKKVVFIANILKYSPLAIATSRKIISPKQLKGKKIMGLSAELNNTPLLAMLQEFNIKLEDVNVVKPSFDINDLIRGKVDGMVVFTTNEVYLMDKKGFKYNLLKPSTYGVDFYDLNIFTSKDEVLNHTQRVRNFKKATLKGWDYAVNHIDESVNVILKKYNTQHKSREHLLFEALEIKNAMLLDVFKLGSIQREKVNLIAQSFKNLGIVKNTKIDFKEFVFDSHYPPELKLTHKVTLLQQIALLLGKIDLKLVRDIAIGLIIFLLLFIYRQYDLKKLNKKLELKIKEELKKSQAKDIMLFEQNKLVAMGEMMTNIAHQWRQPLASLNGILVNMDYAYHNNTLNKQSFDNYLNEIEDLTTYMSNTIEDFNDFFSPTKNSEDFNLNDLLIKIKKLLLNFRT